MVKLIEVDPADIPTERLGHRGRVSYPLIKSFLESNIRCAKLDFTGMEKNPAYLRTVLQTYIKSHRLPIKIFQAGGEMHLLRLDMDAKGEVNSSWGPQEEPTEGASGSLRDSEANPITSIEVERRFKQEKGETTK